MAGIVDPTVFPLEELPSTASASYTPNTIEWDYALGGVPLLSGATKEHPMIRQTAQYRKDQIDTTVQPGEQSTNFWWLRSQSSFHGGTGIIWEEPALDPGVLYSDPLSAVAIPVRFQDGEGVNVWIPGQVGLLPKTTQLTTYAGQTLMMGCKDANGVDCWFEIGSNGTDNTLLRGTVSGDTPTTTTVETFTGYGVGHVTSLTNDGVNWYASVIGTTLDIWTGKLDGTGSATKAWSITGTFTNAVVGWVKQRIIAATNLGLYELITQGTVPSPFGSLPANNYVWTAIAEAPAGVYLSGYSGMGSTVMFVTAGQGLQSVPVLMPPIQVAVMPPDERVTALLVAEGSELIIGSTAGVRVAEIDSNNGAISWGPLIIAFGQPGTNTDTGPVYGLTSYDRFIFAGLSNGMADNTTGLGRIDLGFQVAYERFAWAKDLRAHVTGTVRCLSQLGTSGRLLFSVDGQGTFIESASKLEANGFLTTGNIRYHTLDPKLFKFVNVQGIITAGTINVEAGFDGGSPLSLFTYDAGTATYANYASGDVSMPVSGSHRYCTLTLTIKSDATNTTGPLLTSYQIKSLPAQQNQRAIQLPVKLFDHMQDRNGIAVGYDGYAVATLEALEAMEEARDAVMFQDFTRDPFSAVLVVIDQMEFVQENPPTATDGWGGYLVMALRTLTHA